MKSKKNTQPTSKNTFKVIANLEISESEMRPVLRWINLQHVGTEKLSMDMNVKYSKEHKDASWRLNACRKAELTFKSDKNGNWTLIDSKISLEDLLNFLDFIQELKVHNPKLLHV